ncbi:ClbS/DfsB family four-helix bundle protein [Cyclobacterium sp. 1_MG-2023]|uniref:ClbS/DfsB family four-helix bundle protein n=1 Tax=Cyclobacterium sp. 1_MG-2023 TaxID=3062681 RepID=UPI0026E44380|nr:ClbS/DfsB family four-helix bundle protein [Cyclobacterium sp. 1_MG-2023]MDO6438045.1 ClbS/DfsB family four-helix bundle protein [Cyclobacterium sp. 1_MG-2023]
MPRPQSKDELIFLSQKNFDRLMDEVNAYPEEKRRQAFPPLTLNRDIKDVLAHLHQWHLMMLEWYRVGMKGQKPDIPAKGYTWKTLPELNRKIQVENENLLLEEAIDLVRDSHKKIHKIMNQHTNEELFEKKRYNWTGSTSLGAYLISNSSSHYDWASKLIKKSLKNL